MNKAPKSLNPYRQLVVESHESEFSSGSSAKASSLLKSLSTSRPRHQRDPSIPGPAPAPIPYTVPAPSPALAPAKSPIKRSPHQSEVRHSSFRPSSFSEPRQPAHCAQLREFDATSSTTVTEDLGGPTGGHRMVVAIDYGTTFSGIGYAVHDSSHPELANIHIIVKWGEEMANEVKIPSVISYSPVTETNEQQFGSSLSPAAIAMIDTKLQLEAQDNRIDELDLIIQVLEGTKNLSFGHVKRAHGIPDYTWKSPEVIVSDYLKKAYTHFETGTEYLTEIKNNVPIDIIITVPVRWSYKAKNSTFKAIRDAGFSESNFPNVGNYYLVTEPEAAALFTARFLKEEEAETLKIGECFVLCDAGGGTVDVVSYKVKKVEPNLELEQITIPTGAKYGSSFINAKFRNWLHGLLGDDIYNLLDPRSDGEKMSALSMEGGSMRLVMQQFERIKKRFHGASTETELELPEPLRKLDIPGKIEKGDLTLTNEDMRYFFDDCINGAIELIQSQITQVEGKRNRVKTIFLIGGFSESQFLQEELAFSLKLRHIRLRRPQTSWSAVVKGAVLYGMDLANRKNHVQMLPCRKSLGLLLNSRYSKGTHDARDAHTNPYTEELMARSQFYWFITKGDLLLMAKESRLIEKRMRWEFPEHGRKVWALRLFEYKDDDLPDRYETAQEETQEVGTLTVDLSSSPVELFEKYRNPRTGQSYYRVYLTCKFVVEEKAVTCGAYWNDKLLDEKTLAL